MQNVMIACVLVRAAVPYPNAWRDIIGVQLQLWILRRRAFRRSLVSAVHEQRAESLKRHVGGVGRPSPESGVRVEDKLHDRRGADKIANERRGAVGGVRDVDALVDAREPELWVQLLIDLRNVGFLLPVQQIGTLFHWIPRHLHRAQHRTRGRIEQGVSCIELTVDAGEQGGRACEWATRFEVEQPQATAPVAEVRHDLPTRSPRLRKIPESRRRRVGVPIAEVHRATLGGPAQMVGPRQAAIEGSRQHDTWFANWVRQAAGWIAPGIRTR